MSSQQSHGGEVEILERETDGDGMGLMSINAAEINQQIATAKRYPRSIKEFVREATEMVSMNQSIAAECMYSLKRGRGEDSKVIEGPSARMAEIVASAWGNCRAGARVVGEDDRFVTAQGGFIDLQRNVAITYEVRRRITDSKGRKYSDDMVGVTANAACSIALRNAVFKGVPKAFWSEIYRVARATAIGDAKTLGTRRQDMLAAFGKMGVGADKVFALLEVKGVEDISLDHLALMVGIFQSIRDGEQTIEEAFTVKTDAGAMSAVGSKFGRDKEPAGGSTTEPAKDSNNDVRGTQPAADGAPADAWAVDWLDMIGQAGSGGELDGVEKIVKDAKTLSADQKVYLVNEIGKRRKAVK